MTSIARYIQPFVQEVSKQFKVLYFNAQSCRNKTIELCDFIQESNADLVFITETWFMAAGDKVISDFQISDFQNFPRKYHSVWNIPYSLHHTC
ncbi:hypothetical protein ACOMHN_019802 [Nucella lapillus]